jgi:alcohol dehydrogenase class IV
MGEVIGVAGGAQGLADAFAKVAGEIGLPTRLRDVGVTWPELQSVVPGAVRDHSSVTNPRPMDAADVETLFRAAY